MNRVVESRKIIGWERPGASELEDRIIQVASSIYIVCICVFDYLLPYQAALVLMAFLVFVFHRRSHINPSMGYVCAYALLVGYFFLHTSLGFSAAESVSYDRMATMLVNLTAIIALVYSLRDGKSLHCAMNVIVAIAIFFSIYVIVVLGPTIFEYKAWFRIPKPLFGSFYSHNDIPVVMGLAVCIIVYFINNGSPKRITVLPVAIVVLLFSLILISGARKALICSLFGVIVFPVFVFGAKRNLLMRVLLVCLSVALLYFATLIIEPLYALIGYRLEDLVNGFATGIYADSSAASRSNMNQFAWQMIREQPLIGYGLGSFSLYSSYGTWAENTYTELWFSGGFIPVFLYGGFYVYACVKLFMVHRDSSLGLFMGCLSLWILVNSFFTVAYTSRLLELVSVLICSALIGLDSEESSDASGRLEPKIRKYMHGTNYA